MNESHDTLRNLIHQSLISDKLTPSAELRTAIEQRLDAEIVVSPVKPQPIKPRRRVRAWHMALVAAAALVVVVYFSLPNRWKHELELRGGWTSNPMAMSELSEKSRSD